MGQGLYVGDLCHYVATGWAEIDVKNRFEVGDTVELIHPQGNLFVRIEAMERVFADGATLPVEAAPGSGHVVRVPLPPGKQGAFLVRPSK